MSSSADLSIIITNKDKPSDQLEQCVWSVRNQTVIPKEIILIDDGSNNPSMHKDIISVLLPENVGVAKARDLGVRYSTGKLILFVDADDILAPDFIQQCGRVIEKVDITYPNLLLFGAIPKPVLVDLPNKITEQYLTSKSCQIPVTSMMFREVYKQLGGFRELPVFEDWDFWVRAFSNGYTFARANTLLNYRQSPNSRNQIDFNVRNKTHAKIMRDYEKSKQAQKES
jgi:glycosyltransferase involved in cell wall biosynthesis